MCGVLFRDDLPLWVEDRSDVDCRPKKVKNPKKKTNAMLIDCVKHINMLCHWFYVYRTF